MKAKEPMLSTYGNNMIPHLRSYIVDKVEGCFGTDLLNH